MDPVVTAFINEKNDSWFYENSMGSNFRQNMKLHLSFFAAGIKGLSQLSFTSIITSVSLSTISSFIAHLWSPALVAEVKKIDGYPPIFKENPLDQNTNYLRVSQLISAIGGLFLVCSYIRKKRSISLVDMITSQSMAFTVSYIGATLLKLFANQGSQNNPSSKSFFDYVGKKSILEFTDLALASMIGATIGHLLIVFGAKEAERRIQLRREQEEVQRQ